MKTYTKRKENLIIYTHSDLLISYITYSKLIKTTDQKHSKPEVTYHITFLFNATTRFSTKPF